MSSAPTDLQRVGMSAAVRTQCLGIVAEGMVVNGILLLYLTALGVGASQIMVLLAVYPMTAALTLLPFAWLADRVGKKRVGSTGLAIGLVGWGMIALVGSLPPSPLRLTWLGVAIGLAGLCFSMMGAGWFSLLSPIVPGHLRGRFFGRMRTLFSSISLALSLGYAAILDRHSGILVYQVIFGVATIAYLGRWISYRRIPELEPPSAETNDTRPFLASVAEVLRMKPLVRFCSFILLFGLFTAGTNSLLALLEKSVIKLGDGQVVLLANLSVGGAIIGMFFGGRLVDRLGTRPVFVASHLVIGLALVANCGRVLFGGGSEQVPFLAALHLFLGIGRGAIGIAITTDLMGLLPTGRKSMAASAFSIFQTLGVALSSLLPALLLKTAWLPAELRAGQLRWSEFDQILFGFGVLTLLLLAALSWVPSMRRPAEPASLGLNRL